MLENLTTKKNIKTFSISPENLTGEKGGGGRAVVGSASEASRELGIGWKVNPYLKVEAHSTVVLADYKGQGAIKHIWAVIYNKGHMNNYDYIRIFMHLHPLYFCTKNVIYCNTSEFVKPSNAC